MHLRTLVIATFLATGACAGAPRSRGHDEAGARDALVGVKSIEFAPAGRTAFRARVWYPTSGGTPQTISANAVRAGYQAVPDGVVSVRSPAPLVILCHGSGGGAEGMAWIAVDLAARGAIVIAADHPASSYGDGERRSILDVWEQPDDVRAMIDQLGRSEWSARIDPDRIAVAGFSLGGTTAMLLAGARLEFEKVQEFCKTHRDGVCEGLAPHVASLDAAFFKRANADHSDRRIRAAVAIAPGFTEAMTAESLHALTPTLLIAGERDQQLPPETHVRPMLEHLRPPSGYREIASAQHYSFLLLCRPNASELLAGTDEQILCQEVAGRTREQIHAEALELTAKFLLDRGVLAERP